MARKQELSARAVQFAKNYVEFVEALKREGVPEDIAREEARSTALSLLYGADVQLEYDPALGPCPTCGRG